MRQVLISFFEKYLCILIVECWFMIFFTKHLLLDVMKSSGGARIINVAYTHNGLTREEGLNI